MLLQLEKLHHFIVGRGEPIQVLVINSVEINYYLLSICLSCVRVKVCASLIKITSVQKTALNDLVLISSISV